MFALYAGGVTAKSASDDGRVFPVLTDGVIKLSVLLPVHAADHLAGEDDESRRWLSPASSIGDVQAFIVRNRRSWSTGGPRRAFGVWDVTSEALVGSVESNRADPDLRPGEVNISYAIWPDWRGRGYAARAVDLIMEWLSTDAPGRWAVIRVDSGNTASLAVPLKVGFVPEPSADSRGLRRFVKRIDGGRQRDVT